MTRDIKATVDELERLERVYQSTGLFTNFTAFNDALLAACEGMFAELRRLWAKEARQDAIEEAVVRYREALDVFNRQFVDRACPELAMAKQDACNALFAALPPRPSGGEEAKK